MTQSMRAIIISEAGDADVLQLADMPVPSPKAGEVLIKVAAAGINRGDIYQRHGLYPAPPGAPDWPGLEVSGTVAALGEGVTTFAEGDEVMALIGGGGYAEYAIAPAAQTMPVPKGVNLVEAAALPETIITVWANVFDSCGLKSGDSFMVHGGSSGIGTTAIQMAKAQGAKVFTTAGSTEKCAACVALGADRAINYREEDFVQVIAAETGGKGLDIILDMVGADYVDRNIQCLGMDGRLTHIAFLNGSKVEVDLMRLMLKRLVITGSTLRARTETQKAALIEQVNETVVPWIEAGKVKPVVHARFPLDQAPDAHRMMEASTHIGKILLVP
ncbi:MAG: NAD(P)H-quinone oxidoreductase [Alphaproteobacteria bacterium]